MNSSSFPIVYVENGPVKGLKARSVMNQNYFSFRGIPYMTAPLGKLRFREGKTPRNWTDPFDATHEGPSYCMTDFMTSEQDGQENAGTINVYTKDLNPEKLKPVLIWVRMRQSGKLEIYSRTANLTGPWRRIQPRLQSN